MTIRTAIITGATSGMGEATARKLAELGINLVITGRNQSKLDNLASQLGKNSHVLAKNGDISNPDFIGELLEFSYSSINPKPSIYILSAGVGLPGSILSSDPNKWRELIELNYISVLHQLRQCAEQFIKNPAHEIHDIIVIGSTAGRNPAALNSVYASTKTVLIGLIDSLRQELCQHNIRVSLLEPGFTASGFQKAASYSQATLDKLQNELGEMLQPEDIANTISFMINQPASVHIDNIRIRPLRQK